TLVGSVRDPRQLDTHGYAAELEVERVLAGAFQPGDQVRIGWEEMAPSRRPRFRDGGRVLIALEALPGYSLWRARFPDGRAHAVAFRGEAFLRDPDAKTVAHLQRFVALPEAERNEAAGVESLTAMVAEAHADVASSARDQLARVSNLSSKLGDRAVAWFKQGLRDAERPSELRESLLELIGRRKLSTLRSVVVELARPGAPLEAAATAALAELDGTLPLEKVNTLLASPRAALRVVGVKWARGSAAERRLTSLVRTDPDPAVRIAALETLVAWRGLLAYGDAEPALLDPEPAVRARAARAIGNLGPEIVPRLRSLLERSSRDEATGPIAALAFSGEAGQAALREVAAEHPDEQVRRLVALALGRNLDPH
ncbi:MAG: HEAT repeat domain-containing protein, partial [Myxococcota bacterium]